MSTSRETSDHQQLRDLCAAFALGCLEPEESARMETHLRSGCGSCAEEIEEHRRAMGELGALHGPVIPPAAAMERLMERVSGSTRRASPPIASSRPRRWLAAAAALVLVASVVVAVDSRLRLERVRNILAIFETTTDPIVRIVDLIPTEAAAGARARTTYDPRTSLWRLFTHDMAAPPAGSVYQAWLLEGGAATSLGTFLPDGSGHGVLAVELPGGRQGVACLISIEPAGGSVGPEGEIVFRSPGAPAPRP